MIIVSSWIVHANGLVTTIDGRRADGKRYNGVPPKRRGKQASVKALAERDAAAQAARDRRRHGFQR